MENKNSTNHSPCYIIAEISHNHQGQEKEVMKIIKEAALNGASAVKFQKRDNDNLFLPEFYKKPYLSDNSFGTSYGEHRLFLEPKIKWLKKANQLAHKLKLDFIMTVFDEASLLLCERELKVDAYKIQSADLTNHFLIQKVAAIRKSYFISCGAASLKEIKETYKFCKSLKTNFCLMYAVSEYPTKSQNINLKRISQLKRILKFDNIGFSCHFQTIEPAILARMLGVTTIEKHFTLDKNQKGPDHKLSILPNELKKLREQLSEMDRMLGSEWLSTNTIENYQSDARYKMGKCAVVVKDLKAGHILNRLDFTIKSPMEGMNPSEVKKMIGTKIKNEIKSGGVILKKHFI